MKRFLLSLTVCLAMHGQNQPAPTRILSQPQRTERNKLLAEQNNALAHITDDGDKALALIDLAKPDPTGDNMRRYKEAVDTQARQMIAVETATLDQLTKRNLIEGPADLKSFVDNIAKLKAVLKPVPTVSLDRISPTFSEWPSRKR